MISGTFWSFPTIPDHGAVMGRLTGWLDGVGLQPRVTTRNPSATPRWSSAPTLGAFLTLPTILITLRESTLGSRTPMEAVDMSHRALTALKQAPQRLNQAATLALALASQAARGDSPTHSHGKSRPTWVRRHSFLIPNRVVHLLSRLQHAHCSQQKSG